jgi:hypothetical protein
MGGLRGCCATADLVAVVIRWVRFWLNAGFWHEEVAGYFVVWDDGIFWNRHQSTAT